MKNAVFYRFCDVFRTEKAGKYHKTATFHEKPARFRGAFHEGKSGHPEIRKYGIPEDQKWRKAGSFLKLEHTLLINGTIHNS